MSTDAVEPEVQDDPPVYDERGNVRPRGTEGARPMSYDERVEIAARLKDGEQIVTTAEQPPTDDDDAEDGDPIAPDAARGGTEPGSPFGDDVPDDDD